MIFGVLVAVIFIIAAVTFPELKPIGKVIAYIVPLILGWIVKWTPFIRHSQSVYY